LDLTRNVPVLLRPGGVSVETIESLLGVKVGRVAPLDVRAPGMLASHYAPRAQVEIVDAERLSERAAQLEQTGLRVAVLVSKDDDRSALGAIAGVRLLDLGQSDDDAARRLYAALRQADVDGADIVLASPPATRGIAEALADRLTKAAGPRT
jgi:L-threonylcarbamoyladenylate synthase